MPEFEELEQRIGVLNDQIATKISYLHVLQERVDPLEKEIGELYSAKYILERKLVGVTKVKPKGFRFKTLKTSEVKLELSDDLTALLAENGVMIKGV
jgi:predicted  nucleic acid-binding Zn-ribbon protein